MCSPTAHGPISHSCRCRTSDLKMPSRTDKRITQRKEPDPGEAVTWLMALLLLTCATNTVSARSRQPRAGPSHQAPTHHGPLATRDMRRSHESPKRRSNRPQLQGSRQSVSGCARAHPGAQPRVTHDTMIAPGVAVYQHGGAVEEVRDPLTGANRLVLGVTVTLLRPRRLGSNSSFRQRARPPSGSFAARQDSRYGVGGRAVMLFRYSIGIMVTLRARFHGNTMGIRDMTTIPRPVQP